MKKLIILLVLLSAALNAAPLKIAENGKALAGILIPADAKPITTLVRLTLVSHTKTIHSIIYHIIVILLVPFNK